MKHGIDNQMQVIEALRGLSLEDLWTEIGKRLDVNFGKVQMAFHEGRPSEYAEIRRRVRVEVSKRNNREVSERGLT